MIADRSRTDPGMRRWLRSPLWRDIANVPLLVRLPGNRSRADARLVSAIDLAPTITDLFGLETPEQFLGSSLLPLVTSPQGPGREVAISAIARQCRLSAQYGSCEPNLRVRKLCGRPVGRRDLPPAGDSPPTARAMAR